MVLAAIKLDVANGEHLERDQDVAHCRYNWRVGEEGDETLVGALTLDAFGLSLDPLRRELKPLQMVL